MKWNHWIRQIHRWLSVIFTVAVIINFAALAMQSQAVWIGFLAAAPLIPLLLTGGYLFVLPYTAKGRTSGPAR